MFEYQKTLYENTLECLQRHGKTFDDVLWIGNKDFYIDIENFVELAKKCGDSDIYHRYSDDYSTDDYAVVCVENIPEDIIIVGNDFWLERKITDTCLSDFFSTDCWEYREKPIKPNVKRKINVLTARQACMKYKEPFEGEYTSLNQCIKDL